MNYVQYFRLPYIVLTLLAVSLFGCGGGGSSSQTGISGVTQKGDFLKDSQVSYARFSKNGESSSERLDSLINDNKGNFAVVLPWKDWTKISVTGIFYNEYIGTNSNVALTLNGITDLNEPLNGVNVNLFTHLAAARIEYLVNHEGALDISNRQALSEIKSLFGLTNTKIARLNLTKNGDPDNAVLLLFSSGFLAANNQDLWATSLDNLSNDFADNGLIDGLGVSVFQSIANYSGKPNVLTSVYNNLIARGYSNPPNKSTLEGLPTWVNHSPTVIIEGSESGKTIVFGESVTLRGSAVDTDGTIHSYLWAENNITKGTEQTINLNGLSIGEHFIRLTATDNEGASSYALIKITVNSETNKAPISNAGADKVIRFGDSVQLIGSASDSDGSIVSWSWKQNGNIMNSGNGSTIPPLLLNNLTLGNHKYDLFVVDDDGAVASDSVVITVNTLGNNNPPIANAGFNKTINFGESVTLNGSARDTDGQIASWNWSLNNQIIKNGTGSNILPLVRKNLSIGDHWFTLTVKDNDGASTSDRVKVTVVTVVGNKSPIANAGPNRTINFGESVTLNGSGRDTDGQITSWSWSLNNQIIKRGTGSNILPLVKNNLAIGDHWFTLTVKDDDGASTSDRVKVTVTAVGNRPPVANAGADKTIKLGQSITLNGSASDADGSIVSWRWKQGSTILDSGSGSQISSYTINNLNIGEYTYTLEVTDNKNAVDTDEVIVKVISAAGNTPPTANAGNNKVIVELQALTLTGSGEDADGNIQSYEWKEGSKLLSSSKSVDLQSLSSGSHNLTLTVTDDQGATGSDVVVIDVKPLSVNLTNQSICRSKYGFNIQVIYALSGNKTGTGTTEINLYSQPGCTGTRSDPTGIGFARYAPAVYTINSVSASGTSGRMAITSQGKSSTRSIDIDNTTGQVTKIN